MMTGIVACRFKMSKLSHLVLMLGAVDLGTGAVASMLAILWAYQTQSDFDRGTIVGLIKIFMGGAVVVFLLSAIYIYSAKH